MPLLFYSSNDIKIYISSIKILYEINMLLKVFNLDHFAGQYLIFGSVLNIFPCNVSSELFSCLTAKRNRLCVYFDKHYTSCLFIVFEIIYFYYSKKSEAIYHRLPHSNPNHN